MMGSQFGPGGYFFGFLVSRYARTQKIIPMSRISNHILLEKENAIVRIPQYSIFYYEKKRTGKNAELTHKFAELNTINYVYLKHFSLNAINVNNRTHNIYKR